MISNENLIQDLKNLKEKLGKTPKASEYKKFGKYNLATFNRRFGTWYNIILLAFGEKGKIRLKKNIHPCPVCNKETQYKYCSHSCAAIITNLTCKRKQKPKNIRLCIQCRNKVSKKTRGNLCRLCFNKKEIEKFGEKIISEFKSQYARHKYQLIRGHAKRVMNHSKIEKKCKICGYKHHVEICHIKSIKDFAKDTKLSIVNSIYNLIYLCPTHHWELDNNILKITEHTEKQLVGLEPT